MEITWDIEPDKMIEQLTERYVAAIRQGISDIAKRRAPEITVWMQTNHPWVNRTGEAESRLNTTVDQVEAEIVELLMAHGVTYGWYLEGVNPALMREMANAGRWAILAPAVDVWGPVIMQDIRRLVGG